MEKKSWILDLNVNRFGFAKIEIGKYFRKILQLWKNWFLTIKFQARDQLVKLWFFLPCSQLCWLLMAFLKVLVYFLHNQDSKNYHNCVFCTQKYSFFRWRMSSHIASTFLIFSMSDAVLRWLGKGVFWTTLSQLIKCHLENKMLILLLGFLGILFQ